MTDTKFIRSSRAAENRVMGSGRLEIAVRGRSRLSIWVEFEILYSEGCIMTQF